MSQFDLKQAHVFIRDGYGNSGAVSHTSGYDPGASSIDVDGFTGVVENGDIVNIAGDQTNYTVMSHTETLGNTTNFTVSPPLTKPTADNAVVTVLEPNADLAGAAAPYAITVTTILINNFVGLIAAGDLVKFAGDATVYEVASSIPTLGNTTSITLTSGLTKAVVMDQTITVYQDNGLTGAVNSSIAGYNPGTSAIGVSGFTGPLHVNDVFFIAGDPDAQKYRVTEVYGNGEMTTGIAFEPPTGPDFQINNGAIITIGPHELDVKLGEGNLTYSETKNREYKLDRGKISEVRNGDEAPVDIKLDAVWEWITASAGEIPTIEDCLKRRGVAADWISSDTEDTCRPYAVDIVIEYHPECDDGTEMETIFLSDFRYEKIDHDAKAGTFSITGKCNITEATAVRSAAIAA